MDLLRVMNQEDDSAAAVNRAGSSTLINNDRVAE